MKQRLNELEERVTKLEQYLVEAAFRTGEIAGKSAAGTATSHEDKNPLINECIERTLCRKIKSLRNQTIQVGKEVSELYTSTNFPDNVLFKVGEQLIRNSENGLSRDYCEGLITASLTLITQKN